MFIKLVSSLLACTSILALYYDYVNRKSFQENFPKKNKVGKKLLLTGFLSIGSGLNGLSDKPKISVNGKIFNIDKCPVFKIDTVTLKNKLLGYHNLSTNTDFLSYELTTPIQQSYWIIRNNFEFFSPHAKFNNKLIVLKKNAVVHYTNTHTHYLNYHKRLVENYIPNNSKVTIFAKEINDVYRAEFIGNKREVLNDIAIKYYGISDTYTSFWVGTLIGSLFYLVYIIKN